MNVQIIKSIEGRAEYALVPIKLYRSLQKKIDTKLKKSKEDLDEYVPFSPEDYVENPVALARIKACITQDELASAMEVSQAYISKIEKQKKLTPKLLNKAKLAIKKRLKRKTTK